MGMRKWLVRSMMGLVAVLAFSAVALAQAPKPGSKDSLYKGNRLKPDPTPGGPAPVHDVNGSWAGNLTPERLEIPPLTPFGQKMFSMNKPETEVGTGAERVLAAARIFFAGSSLAAIATDPTQPARYSSTTYLLLGGYLIIGLAVWMRVLRTDPPSFR